MADSTARIRILKNPDVTDLAGEKVMIDFDSGKYFMLTGAANDIWDMLGDGVTVSEIVGRVMEIYEVKEQECLEETLAFLEKLEGIGFIALDTDA